MPLIEAELIVITSHNGDWEEVFGFEGHGPRTSNRVKECRPGSGIDTMPFERYDIDEIIASAEGERDEQEWICVCKLVDGRFAVAYGYCGYSGWDFDAHNHIKVAATLNELVTFGLSDHQRRRLQLGTSAECE
jgi:hypothetical protein